MRVAGTTSTSKLAGAIIHGLRAGREVRLISIGMLATYQVIKALATLREYLLDDAIELCIEIAWLLIEDADPDQERTALQCRVWRQNDVQS